MSSSQSRGFVTSDSCADSGCHTGCKVVFACPQVGPPGPQGDRGVTGIRGQTGPEPGTVAFDAYNTFVQTIDNDDTLNPGTDPSTPLASLTYIPVQLNVAPTNVGGFTFTPNDTFVTVDAEGYYMITARFTSMIDSNAAQANQRTDSVMRLRIGGVAEPGTFGQNYNRINSNANPTSQYNNKSTMTANVTAVRFLSANTTVSVEVARRGGRATLITVPEASSLTIVKI